MRQSCARPTKISRRIKVSALRENFLDLKLFLLLWRLIYSFETKTDDGGENMQSFFRTKKTEDDKQEIVEEALLANYDSY